jgi:subtilisin family serine protease
MRPTRSWFLAALILAALVALSGLDAAPAGEASSRPSEAVPADPGPRPGPAFVEVAGQRLLSGRLVARPLQRPALLEAGADPAEADARLTEARARLAAWRIELHPEVDEHVLEVPAGRTEADLAAELLATGLYEYVEPDWLVAAAVEPNDPLYESQWHLDHVAAPAAWDIEVGDGTVIVAVCDSGVDLDHPDLVDRLVPGYNAVDALPQSEGGQVDGLTDHGTMVAGIVAAAGNNAAGVSGAGWNLRIMPIRVRNTPDDMALISVLNDGARWAAEHGAGVVNTSFSGVISASVQTTGQYIREQGGSSVWAAGNSNVALDYVDHPDVLIVGATDQADSKASFSNYGAAVDIVAPGVQMLTTLLGGTYGAENGTSFAAPLAAGAIALVRTVNPALSPEDAELVLSSTVVDLGAAGDDNVFGHGRLDLAGAVGLAADALGLPLAPVAEDDLAIATTLDPLVIDVLANDRDLNLDPLSIAAASATTPSGGLVEILPAGGPDERDRLRITPVATFEGIESIEYTVADPGGLTDTATVSVAIASPPILADPEQITIGSGAQHLESGDFDGDGDLDLVVVRSIAFLPVQVVEQGGDGVLTATSGQDLGDPDFGPDGVARATCRSTRCRPSRSSGRSWCGRATRTDVRSISMRTVIPTPSSCPVASPTASWCCATRGERCSRCSSSTPRRSRRT